MTMERYEILLHRANSLVGMSPLGCRWVRFEGREATCSACGKIIESGWWDIDCGDEVCNDHVTLVVNQAAQSTDS
jgi:hypothetical protein